MNFLSKIFGIDRESEKRNKFKEIEQKTISGLDTVNLGKAIWLTTRGNSSRLKGKFDESIEDFTEAIKIKNDYLTAYISLGAIYTKRQMHKKAIDIMESAIIEFDSFNRQYIQEFYYALGIIYADKAYSVMQEDLEKIKIINNDVVFQLKQKAILNLEKSLEIYNDFIQNPTETEKVGKEKGWIDEKKIIEMVEDAKQCIIKLKQS